MKGGSHRTRRLLKAWGAALGLMLLLQAAFFAVWAALDYLRLVSVTAALALAGVFMVGLAVVMVTSWRLIDDAHVPREDREARASGRPATARVVSIERTRWRTGRHLNFRLQVTPRRWEYRIFVRVQPPGEADYEAELAEFLLHDEVPRPGDVLNVRVHPARADAVVWMR